jgi:multidrug efflux pump subunit AcrA (membrane-fusion protein)
MDFAKRHGWKFALGLAALVLLVIWAQPDDADASADLIVSPERGPFRVAVTATGELRAKNSTQIFGPSGVRQARIFEMKILRMVPEGTVVRQGQFVAELDKSELQGRIQDEQVELDKAQSQYTQTQLDTALTLSEARDGLINLRYAMEEAELRKEQARYEPPSVQRQAEIDFEKAERALAQAQTNYVTKTRQAEAQMQEVEAELRKRRNSYAQITSLADDFTIAAPENGMVIYRRDWNGNKTAEGSTVNAWNPIVAELPDLSVMESVTYVNEVDIQKIGVGQEVEIGLDADADKRLRGRVTSVANIGEQRPNSDAKVFEVSILIDSATADSTLRPAMTTSNTIIVAELEDALSVPLEALHASDSLSYVYLKDGVRTVRQEVAVGMLNENAAVIQAGLAGDERIYLSLPPEGDYALRRLGPEEQTADELAAM